MTIVGTSSADDEDGSSLLEVFRYVNALICRVTLQSCALIT